MSFYVGSYVIHRKLAELGSGEIISSELGSIIIRFASGDRRFSEELVGAHLEKTNVAPVLMASGKRKARSKKS